MNEHKKGICHEITCRKFTYIFIVYLYNRCFWLADDFLNYYYTAGSVKT
jgi:hypothetical protein